jgi:hypothetical protein
VVVVGCSEPVRRLSEREILMVYKGTSESHPEYESELVRSNRLHIRRLARSVVSSALKPKVPL